MAYQVPIQHPPLISTPQRHVSGQQVMWSGHGGFPGSFWAAEGHAPCIGQGQLHAWKVIQFMAVQACWVHWGR